MTRLTEYHNGVAVIKGKRYKEAAEKLAKYEYNEKRGYWKYLSCEMIVPHFRCSICNSPRYEHYANQFLYCPNCGADMRGGNDE